MALKVIPSNYFQILLRMNRISNKPQIFFSHFNTFCSLIRASHTTIGTASFHAIFKKNDLLIM